MALKRVGMSPSTRKGSLPATGLAPGSFWAQPRNISPQRTATFSSESASEVGIEEREVGTEKGELGAKMVEIGMNCMEVHANGVEVGTKNVEYDANPAEVGIDRLKDGANEDAVGEDSPLLDATRAAPCGPRSKE
jgi:hypothetical protein